MILLRARPRFRDRPGRPIAKVTIPERAINRQAREALTAELQPIFAGLIDAFRGDADDEIRRTIAATGQLGLPLTSMAAFNAAVEAELQQTLARAISAGSQIGLRFSGVQGVAISPEVAQEAAQRFIRTAGSTQIQQINGNTRRSVRALVARVARDDLTPQGAANRISQRIGLTDRQARSLDLFEERLVRQRVPTPEADTQLVRESIGQDVERRRDRMVRNRAELIVENEVALGIQEGEREFWNEAIRQGEADPATLLKRWVTVQDNDVCPICRPLNGQVKPYDTSFSSLGFIGLAPPAHVRCRCFLEYGPAGDFDGANDPPPLRPASESIVDPEDSFDPGVPGKLNRTSDVLGVLAQGAKPLTRRQGRAVNSYTRDGFEGMNGLLRARGVAARELDLGIGDIDLLDVADIDIEFADLSRSIKQGIIEKIDDLDQLIADAPGLPDDFVMYRGGDFKPENFADFNVGESFTDDAFGSWTVDRSVLTTDFAARPNAIVFRVRRRRGDKMVFTDHLEESEFIARPGTRYKIVSDEPNVLVLSEGEFAPEDIRRRVITLEIDED